MNKIVIKSILFAGLLMTILCYIDWLSMNEDYKIFLAKITNATSFLEGGVKEILPYIEEAQKKDNTSKLIVGDSVCRQLFKDLDVGNEDFTIIGSNGAITVAGQYILVKEYLDNHPNATHVYLFLLPDSFERTFDSRLGYMYAVMPFAMTNTLNDLDYEMLDALKSSYGKFFIDSKITQYIEKSPVNKKLVLNYLRNRDKGYCLDNRFELANKYIIKINELCESRNVKFFLYPCPVSSTHRDRMDEMAKEFNKSLVHTINPNFFDIIYYFPSEQAEDGAHFSGEYAVQDNFNDIILKAYGNQDIMNHLNLNNSEEVN